MRAVVLAVLLSGCIRPVAETCSDGTVCPNGTTCDTINHRCLTPDQIAACDGLADGAACVYDLQAGTCLDGACDIYYCGDSHASSVEQCDGDDLGKATSCLDLGYYEPGTLTCSPLCSFNVDGCLAGGYCGDGQVNGPETCDGPANQTCISLGFDAGSMHCNVDCQLSIQDCSLFGWNPESLGDLVAYAVGGASPHDLWAVGGNGRTMHYEGAYWSAVPTNVTTNLVGVWGIAANDVWVVGQGSIVLHWDGAMWNVVPGVPNADYVDVWAAASDAVFIATSDQGVLEWNGAAWSTVGTLTGLHPIAIRGASATDVWVATSEGTLVHWDGLAWTPNTPPGAAIHFIDANASDDVWVIGNDSFDPGTGIIAHWTGVWTTWIAPQTIYNNVASSAPNDTWVAGADGAMHHFDGASWTSTYSFGASPSGLAGVSGLISYGSSQVIAVSTLNLAYRYRGQAFGLFPNLGPDPFTATENLAFWSSAADDMYVTNAKGEVWHLDAIGWTNVFTVPASPIPARALWGSSKGDVWIGADDGTVYHFDGMTWTPVVAPAAIPIWRLWGSAPGDVWAFGQFGASHWTGSSWTNYPLSAGSILAVSGAGADDIWVVEQAAPVPVLWHWDGAAWSVVATGATMPISTVVALAANDVFAAAGSGRIEHWNGTAWTETIVPAVGELAFMAATAHDDVIAASERDLFHFDGTQWSEMRPPVDFVPNTLDYVPMIAIAATPGRVDMLMQRFKVRTLIRTRPITCRAHEDDCNDAVDNDCNGRIDHTDPACP
jgi:hypothetical protein